MPPLFPHPADIHTHRLPLVPGSALVSVSPSAFCPQEGHVYSVGLHPWHIGAEGASVEALETALRHPQVLAVGEAGLDRLAQAPVAEVQQPLFEAQVRLADEHRVPLVIHLVKCVDELLALRRRMRPQTAWIVHGFRGKPELARELLRHGLYLSFGEHYHAESLRITPPDRLFLETDESALPIDELYRRAAAVRGVSAEALQRAVQENVQRCFPAKTLHLRGKVVFLPRNQDINNL